jgi:hypothetical protein
VAARTSGRFHGTIARFTFTDPHAVPANFKAEIHWGDGHSSRGRIVASNGGFRVVGSHHFTHEHVYRPRITITASDGARATARSKVTVSHAHKHPSRPPRVSAGFTG